MYTSLFFIFFFFNDTPTTEIYTLSLHDALPIFDPVVARGNNDIDVPQNGTTCTTCTLRRTCRFAQDRKSTRLNSSHMSISYAVFCLKKKKKTKATFPLLKQLDFISIMSDRSPP